MACSTQELSKQEFWTFPKWFLKIFAQASTYTINTASLHRHQATLFSLGYWSRQLFRPKSQNKIWPIFFTDLFFEIVFLRGLYIFF